MATAPASAARAAVHRAPLLSTVPVRLGQQLGEPLHWLRWRHRHALDHRWRHRYQQHRVPRQRRRLDGHGQGGWPGSTWINNGDLYAGYWGAAGGTLSITGGGSVSNNYGYIGHAGSTGTVTVDGAASSWVNRYDLCVGDDTDGNGGVGTLAITHGAAVSVGGATYVGWGNGSTGGIQFGANGGTLTTQSLWASPSQLTGNGTINTQGLVSDVNLVFDSTASLSQTLTFNGPGQNIALHLDMTGDSSTNGVLGAGYQGSGSVTIRNGVTVNSNLGYIGCQSGSAGIVTVDGTGSAWANGNALYVGYSGNGTLAITGGGSVNNNCGYIGYNSGSTAMSPWMAPARVWTNGDFLAIGYSGQWLAVDYQWRRRQQSVRLRRLRRL